MYKQVAVVDNRYLSVFDGRTEYQVGSRLEELAEPEHQGGYYCFETIEDAMTAFFPAHSKLLGAKKAIMEVSIAGASVLYMTRKHGQDGKAIKTLQKYAYSEMEPLSIIPPESWPVGTPELTQAKERMENPPPLTTK